MKIDGKLIASEILLDLKKRVDVLKEKGITPHLYVILLINDDATLSYIKQKKLKSEEIGAKITIDESNPNVTTFELLDKIEKLNNDNTVHGIIVQRPLPKNLDEEKIKNAIIPEKDVDGFRIDSKFNAPVAEAVLKIVETAVENQNILDFLKSKKITVIGKGVTAGKPIINLFEKLNIKINIVDSKTKDKEKVLKESDIIISAVGKDIVKKEELKQGVILVGVGMHTESGKLKGDYNEEEIKDKVSFYTPTPGGVGPVNVAYLMKNLIETTENLL
ncbi:MAG TPA: bifunctional 5,10-methylenetetrahydrofolate dehydrogenase/5,10-methenyltetrahydrofolate cyclohydrolase [Candidatus Sulfotelmatobacter sp.]|nr:bifunctional 5,10-methylenetetrahydrofolate dehydrogenase/5,10-methenyltetrahydrofolate cyclohydrolase [Candidatus Sulfotelmatobacter sp.]